MTDNLTRSQAISGVNRMIKTIKNLESQQGPPIDIAFDTVSNPPTTGEINAAFATPSEIGVNFVGLLVDIANNRNWLVFTDGSTAWYVVNRPQEPLTLTSLLTTAGITNVGAITHTGTTRFPTASLTLVNGDNNNIVLSANATYVRYTGPTAAHAITGIGGGIDGRIIILSSAVSQALTIRSGSGLSLAANRIATSTGDITVGNGGQVIFIYDGTSSFWRVLSARGSAGAF